MEYVGFHVAHAKITIEDDIKVEGALMKVQ